MTAMQNHVKNKIVKNVLIALTYLLMTIFLKQIDPIHRNEERAKELRRKERRKL